MKQIKKIRFSEIKYHPAWEKVQMYANNNRRSGRSKLIIANAILELLSTGSCIIVEHQGSPDNTSYYSKFTLNWFYDAMLGLFRGMDYKELHASFEIRFILDDDITDMCMGLYVIAKNQGFQYETGFEPYKLKAAIKNIHQLHREELNLAELKYNSVNNMLELVKGSLWEYLKMRYKMWRYGTEA